MIHKKTALLVLASLCVTLSTPASAQVSDENGFKELRRDLGRDRFEWNPGSSEDGILSISCFKGRLTCNFTLEFCNKKYFNSRVLNADAEFPELWASYMNFFEPNGNLASGTCQVSDPLALTRVYGHCLALAGAAQADNDRRELEFGCPNSKGSSIIRGLPGSGINIGHE
jgi:hypothetical protein